MRGRCYVVGPADTVEGLALVGIDGAVVRDGAEARAALDAARARADVALVLLSERWRDVWSDRRETDEGGALVVEIPDPGGGGADATLLERVEALLGFGLEEAADRTEATP